MVGGVLNQHLRSTTGKSSLDQVDLSRKYLATTKETHLVDVPSKYLKPANKRVLLQNSRSSRSYFSGKNEKSYFDKKTKSVFVRSELKKSYLPKSNAKDSYLSSSEDSVLDGHNSVHVGESVATTEAFEQPSDVTQTKYADEKYAEQFESEFDESSYNYNYDQPDTMYDDELKENPIHYDEEKQEAYGMTKADMTAALQAMGYSFEETLAAMNSGNGNDLMVAVNFLEDRRQEKANRKKLLKKVAFARPSPAFSPPPPPNDAKLKEAEKLKTQLLQMGFPKYKVVQALRKGKTVEECLDYLANSVSSGASNEVGRRASSAVYDRRLPRGWDMRYNDKGKRYFSNHSTRDTQWNDPRPLPDGWTRHKDQRSGKYYYKSSKLKSTQWDDPRGPIEPGNAP